MTDTNLVRPKTAEPRALPRRLAGGGRLRGLLENLGTALLAAAIALSIWMAAVVEQNPPREDFYPSDLPIEVVNKPPALILFEPLQRTARVRVRAPQASWDKLQANGDRALTATARALIDLTGATPGLREYDVQVKFADPDIALQSVDPPLVALRLEEQRAKTFGVQINVGDSPPIGYLLGTPQSTPASVAVSGAQSRVDQVVEVVAAAQLRGSKSTVERDIAPIARDAQGNTVAGVIVSPDTVHVTVPVEQRIGFKDVSVKVVTKGTVAGGYWLSNVAVDPSTVTVVGSPARLDEIGGFIPTEPIDIKDSKSSTQVRVGLVLPQGVSPIGTQNVLVTIDVAPITGGQTVQRQITTRGLDKALKATLSPESVDVILGGPLPVLQALKVDDVQVIIDLAGKGPGKYKLTPTLVKPDSLMVESIVPDSIEVVISK